MCLIKKDSSLGVFFSYLKNRVRKALNVKFLFFRINLFLGNHYLDFNTVLALLNVKNPSCPW